MRRSRIFVSWDPFGARRFLARRILHLKADDEASRPNGPRLDKDIAMPASRDASVFTADERSGWLRLRTLIALRWMALAGQAVVAAACLTLGIDIPLGPFLLILGCGALFNLVARMAAPPSRRLTQREAVALLLFDLMQFAALLHFTGGLSNPFALMLLGPVTIGAAALSLGATLVLCGAAIGVITLLAFAYIPLDLQGGVQFPTSPALIQGAWVALSTGVAFIASYARRISGEIFRMSQALTATQVALDRERRMSAIGGVVAAAAHELGTPLATIKLASAELAEELRDQPTLRADAELIRAQADRCRDILRSMAPIGRQDTHVQTAPISSVLEEAAEPHADRGVRIILRVRGAAPEELGERQPEIARRPEIIQGLRNLVQNAVDFSRTAVWIDIDWTFRAINVSIGDDGKGYPPDMIDRIGEPFMRARAAAGDRPGYDGMGLGLFIAKTLLERSGAELTFRNGSDEPALARPTLPLDFARPTGALVQVAWRRPAGTGGMRGAAGGEVVPPGLSVS